MTSNDNQQYLTVELFNSKMETFLTQIQLGNEQLRNELRSEFHAGFNTLHNEIQAVDARVQVNTAKNEMLQHSIYWGFAIMALVVALVPFFWRERKEKKQKEENQKQNTISKQDVQDMINSSISHAVDEAVAKALRNLGAFGK